MSSSHFPEINRPAVTARTVAALGQRGEPFDCGHAGQVEVLAAADGHEAWQPGESAADRLAGDGVCVGAVVVAGEWILLGAEADEVAVVHPDLLDELELPGQARSQEDEDDAALRPVVLQYAVREDWS